MTVSAIHHAGKFLAPGGTSGRVVFTKDGTITFRHDPARYGALAPQPHMLLERADPLADLAVGACP